VRELAAKIYFNVTSERPEIKLILEYFVGIKSRLIAFQYDISLERHFSAKIPLEILPINDLKKFNCNGIENT